VLAAHPQTAEWQRRVARNEAIMKVLRRVLPRALGAELTVDAGESGELRLVAASGAVAALLRQRGSDLMSALAREGLECTAIRVVVQPRPTAGVDRKTHAIQWDESASQALSKLCGTLPDGPLKAAVGRLLRRH
jgi:hypothetical protein